MGPGQPIELGALVARGAGKKAGGCTEFRGIFVAASCVVSLRLAGLHQSMKVKLVGVSLAMNFGHNILVIVIPKQRGK